MRRLPLLAVAFATLFAGIFTGAALAATPHDGDLDWQRWLGGTILATGRIPDALHGETFSAPGAHWVPHEWLFSLAVALAPERTGMIVLGFVAGAAALATLLLVARRADARGGSALATATVTALCGVALLQSFGVRAQVVAWAFLALLMLLLDRDDRAAWWSLPVVIAWANVHASAALAPVLALAGITERPRGRVALGAALVVALCCSPFGIDLIRYAVDVVNSPMRAEIREWAPVRWSDGSFVYGALPLALCAAAGLGTSRRRRYDAATLALAVLMTASASRNIATAAIVLAPLAARGIDLLLVRAGAARNGAGAAFERRVFIGAAFCGVALAAMIPFSSLGPPAYVAPRAAIAALDERAGAHHLLCEDFAWCSSALGSQRTSVYLDGRTDPFPARAWRDYDRIVRLEPAWRETIAGDGIDAVLARPRRPFARALGREHGWRAVYRDPRYVLFVRTD